MSAPAGIDFLEDGAARPRTLSLFSEDRCEVLLADASIVGGAELSELRLRRPKLRQAAGRAEPHRLRF
jgi:hypothetical protein